jgi:beta-glucosidase
VTNWLQSEGHDRVAIDLPGVQLALAQQIVSTGTPVVVVLINGGAVAIGTLNN